MKTDGIVWKKYEKLNEQIENMIITPKGQVMIVDYQSHDYYIEKMLEEEFGIGRDEMYDMKEQASKEGADWATGIDIIIAKFGYISVHTSGDNVVGWIQAPSKISNVQMNAIKMEYALGKISPLLYDVFMNYEALVNDLPDDMKNKEWWSPYQVDISWIKKRERWHSDMEVENGYSVSVM